MNFTRLVKLQKKTEFDFALLSQYQLLVFVNLSPLENKLTNIVRSTFENRAHAFGEFLFIFPEEESINQEFYRKFELLGKTIENLEHERAYFLVISSQDLLSEGYEFIDAHIIYIDELNNSDSKLDPSGLSEADFALLDSFSRLRQYLIYQREKVNKGRIKILLKILLKVI